MLHPILSITLDIACIISASKYIPKSLPKVIINPAAGITAITTNKAFPNFCQKSNDNNLPFFFVLPILNSPFFICNVIYYKYF